MTRRADRARARFQRRFRIGIIASLIAGLAVTGFVAPAIAAGTRTTGIFSDSLTPKIAADPDRVAVELGVKFSPRTSGTVTALQYYQGSKAKNVTTATLWSSDGRVLARAKFDSSRREGWRTIPLGKPVALKAGKTYTVSYHAPQGGYPVTERDLASKRTQNGFTLPSGAGVYRYGAKSALPTQTYRGSNYLVDIVFSPSRTPSASPTTPIATPKPTASPSVTPRPTPTATPTATPTPTPTATPTPTPTPTPTATPTPTPTPNPPRGGFPTRESAGLPDGWQPARQVTGDVWIREAGAVVEDLRVTNGTIYVDAPNVTLRRIDAVATSVVNDYRNICRNGLVIEDSTFTPAARTTDQDLFVIGPGGYTVRNVLIDGLPEGLRAAGVDYGCGPVNVESSFIRVTSPTVCNDWHGDGIQGYYGDRLTVRNSVVIMEENNGCWGTAAFFYPHSQGNTSLDVDGLIVSGGGYPFRNGMPATVKNLHVLDGTWGYGPIDVKCSAVSTWQANVSRLDAAGQPVPIRPIACSMEGGR